MPAELTAKERSDLRVAANRGAAVSTSAEATVRGVGHEPAEGDCAHRGARTVQSMPAHLTAKKRSDLRVGAIHGAVPSVVAPAAAPMTAPASVHAQAEQLKARLSGLVDRLPGAAVDSDVPVLVDVVALFDMPELHPCGVVRGDRSSGAGSRDQRKGLGELSISSERLGRYWLRTPPVTGRLL